MKFPILKDRSNDNTGGGGDLRGGCFTCSSYTVKTHMLISTYMYDLSMLAEKPQKEGILNLEQFPCTKLSCD